MTSGILYTRSGSTKCTVNRPKLVAGQLCTKGFVKMRQTFMSTLLDPWKELNYLQIKTP